ncbi:MAG: glycerophosphodiester phosphodiesterase family protein [Spirosomataceae bacterium]
MTCAVGQTASFRGMLLKSAHTPLICGHRGGFYDQFPENSFLAFRYAVEQAAPQAVMLELDVRESKDGILYILHDKTLERTTNGTGPITEQSSAYLDGLWLKDGKGQRSQERIPRLEAVLKWLKKQPNVYLMVDVKEVAWAKVMAAIQEAKVLSRCLILTFKLEHTQQVYQAAPKASISALITNPTEWAAIQQSGIPLRNLCAYIGKDTTPTLLHELQQAGIPLLCDVSENTKNHPMPYEAAYYQTYMESKHLNLLVTDYPIEVISYLRQLPTSK